VLRFEFNHTNYHKLLEEFSAVLDSPVCNNRLEFPEKNGNGFMQMYELPNSLHCMVNDYTTATDIMMKRRKMEDYHFMLRLDEVLHNDPLQSEQAEPKRGVSLTNTTYEWIYYAPKHTRVRTISIVFSDTWLATWLGIEAEAEKILQYLSNTAQAMSLDPMDNEYKVWFEEIQAPKCDDRLKPMYIHNRIMLILERFFNRLLMRIDSIHFDSKISSYDMARLREVEAILMKDFSVPPPSIAQLSRTAAMSPSKLKNAFKEAFGLPIYQYFQKHRMNKAKAMLISKKYTVREVSRELGYEQLTNFVKAFQKAFDQNPASINGEA
jgi:AraC-like DNA-binding protein